MKRSSVRSRRFNSRDTLRLDSVNAHHSINVSSFHLKIKMKIKDFDAKPFKN